jgi:hypothetical protein
MNLCKLCRYSTAKGMTEERHARAIKAESDSKVVIGCTGVELCGRVRGASTK